MLPRSLKSRAFANWRERFRVAAQRYTGRSSMAVVAQHRQVKIQYLCLIACGQKQVCRLQIAMNDARLMSCVQSIGNLNSPVEKGVNWNGAALQRSPHRLHLEQFHGAKRPAIEYARVVDGSNIGLIDGGRRTGFQFKSLDGSPIEDRIFRNKLQRDQGQEP